MKAIVHTPYYDWEGRKYLELRLENQSSLVRVKVPFRYNRVMCRVEGLKTVQEFQKGDQAEVTLVTKIWNGEKHLVLESIAEV